MDGALSSKVALLVVDVQSALLPVVDPDGDVLRRNCFAVEVAKLLGLPVFYTEQVPEKLGATHEDLLKAGLEGAPVYSKSAFSAMRAEGLCEALEARGVEHLLITGIETGICVYQTVLDVRRMDYSVTVLSDCVGARREQDHRAIVSAFESMDSIAWLPAETVFYSMLQDAQHTLFRPFTALVKRYA